MNLAKMLRSATVPLAAALLGFALGISIPRQHRYTVLPAPEGVSWVLDTATGRVCAPVPTTSVATCRSMAGAPLLNPPQRAGR